jgi:hypothetical protein
MKWVGDMPTEVVREYCAIIPLIRKFPDLYEYAVNNFDKYTGANQYYNASESAIYNQYNSLMNGGGYYPQYPQYNPQFAQQGYYQQPNQGYPVQQYNGQAANPNVNPMQAQQPMYNQQQMMNPPVVYGNPYYGAQPGYGAPMQQQSVPAQPMPGAPQPYSPVYNPAQGNQQQTAVPNGNAQQSAPAAQTETKEEKITL